MLLRGNLVIFFSKMTKFLSDQLFFFFFVSPLVISVVSTLMGFVPGAFGGVCSVFVGHPMDLIKVRMQFGGAQNSRAAAAAVAATSRSLEGGTSALGMLRGIFVKEGFSGLYRGVQAPLLAVTPAFAVSFWSFDLAGRFIREQAHLEKDEEMSLGQVAMAGGFSGVPLAAIFGPTERIKCLMQVDKGKYNGFLDCFFKVYQDGGIRSVFRGTMTTALRDVPGNAAYFGTYEFIKRLSCKLEGREKASIIGTLLAGGSAGIANWVVAIPIDAVKSRLQTAPNGRYNGFVDAARTLLKEDGPKALFRGLSPALMRAFPANAACLLGVETVKGLLEDR